MRFSTKATLVLLLFNTNIFSQSKLIPTQYYFNKNQESAARDFSCSLYGFKNVINNNLVIPCIYKRVKPFSQDRAAVSIEVFVKSGLILEEKEVWHFIDTVGSIMSNEYDEILSYSEGLAAFKKNNKWGFIDLNGNVVISEQYDNVSSFNSNRALFMLPGEGYGYIDRNNVKISDDRYFEAGVFSSNLAPIRNFTSEWGYIDTNSNIKISYQFAEANSFSEGLASVKNSKGLWGFIDTSGKYVIEPKYTNAGSFINGFCFVKMTQNNDRDWLIINKNGLIVADKVQKGQSLDFSNKLQELFMGYGVYVRYLSESGSVIDPLKILLANEGVNVIDSAVTKELAMRRIDVRHIKDYEIKLLMLSQMSYVDGGPFSEGFASISYGEKSNHTKKWGFIDTNGHLIHKLQFASVTPFTDGISLVALESQPKKLKYGFFNKDGTLLGNTLYDGVRSFSDGKAAIRIGDKWGFINRDGKIVIEPAFSDVMMFYKNLTFVQGGALDKWALIDSTGKFITDYQFENIVYSDVLFAFVMENLSDDPFFIDRKGTKIINGK